MPILTAITNIDTDLLRNQRDWLLEVEIPWLDSDYRDGLVNLLDALLDDAEQYSQPTPADPRPEPRRSLARPEKPAKGPLDEQRRSFEGKFPALASEYGALPGLTATIEKDLRGRYGSPPPVSSADLRTEVAILRVTLERLAGGVAITDSMTANAVSDAQKELRASRERVQ